MSERPRDVPFKATLYRNNKPVETLYIWNDDPMDIVEIDEQLQAMRMGWA